MVNIQVLPKVALHEHLDGGLRPQTIIELAQECNYSLPSGDTESLREWIWLASHSGSLERYLEAFVHTISVMQRRNALVRVARESVIDLAADGVVYAELRWAPEQHLVGGLNLDEAIEAVFEGIEQGMDEARSSGLEITANQIVTAMRQHDRWLEVARVAVSHRAHRVVGFDLAGPEVGYPADRIADVWQFLAANFMPATIHAGEARGIDSIITALVTGRALRIGHGIRVIDDIDLTTETAKLGPVATWVRDRQIALEICPSSNIQTGAVASISEHPISALRDLDFAVTINTDNRLMSATSMTREMQLLHNQAGWTVADLHRATVTAAQQAFISPHEREILVNRINQGYSAQDA